MEELYTDKEFDRDNFSETPLPKGEYEGCRFSGCDFSNTDFSDVKFVDCFFTGCNLSMVKPGKTVLRDVQFKDCKMLGFRFDACSEFGLSFSFDNCCLDYASFYESKIRNTSFRNSQLREVDFTAADLTGCVFSKCDLAKALFERAVLEKADFTSAYNYSINLDINKHKNASFSLPGIVGLLDKYDIRIDLKK